MIKKYFTEEERKEGIRKSRNSEESKRKRRIYLEKNKEKIKLQRRKRYLENKDHYIKNNNKRKKEREQTEPLYKFRNNIRRNIIRSFSRNNSIKFKKLLKSEKLLGCSMDEFVVYLLSKCPEGTTVKDFGIKGYHLDHIIPISSAKTQEEVERLCHYTNYQPLWWENNLQKSNKLI